MPLTTNNGLYCRMYFNNLRYESLKVNGKEYLGKTPIISKFKIVVNSGVNGSFILPTCGKLNNNHCSYSWNVDWGDGTETNESGKGFRDSGIVHTYPSSNSIYEIVISPENPRENGYLRAFGFPVVLTGSGTTLNRDKVLLVDGLLTEKAIRITPEDNDVCSYWFYKCTNIEMGEDFNLAQNLISVGNNFCSSMFRDCSGINFNMNSIFNLPPDITAVGDEFCAGMFLGCNGFSFTMNNVFDVPTNLTTVGLGFCTSMFSGCKGASFTMNSVFNLPQSLTTIENSDFCSGLFSGCNGASFTMNSVFNLPQRLTAINNYNFCGGMFSNCQGNSFMMNSIFNLPQKLSCVHNAFCVNMFYGCKGKMFTMNSIFNLPPNLITAGNSFCEGMFREASGIAFKMNSVFNLPQYLNIVDSYFCCNMFCECSGFAFAINAVFKLPQNLTTIGDSFCKEIFFYCNGNSFTKGAVQFFGNVMLSETEVNKQNAFYSSFYHCDSLTETLAIIPQLSTVPITYKKTFTYCPANSVKGLNTRWYM